MQEGAADPGLYDFTPYRGRKPFAWPNGGKVAVWVSPNLEYYEIDPPTNPHRKAWARPHPDVVGYSHRDHANRVGHWRMAEVMSKHGFPGSVSLSVALCQHHPEVVADANARGWEFFSHGIYNTRYSYGMDEAQERAIIEDSIRTVREATGQTIRGWRMASTRNNQRLEDLARLANPVVRGWLNYYGRFYRSRCVQVLRHFNEALGKWAQRKYTRFRRRERAAMHWLGRIARRDPDLFVLWRQGVRPEAGV